MFDLPISKLATNTSGLIYPFISGLGYISKKFAKLLTPCYTVYMCVYTYMVEFYNY